MEKQTKLILPDITPVQKPFGPGPIPVVPPLFSSNSYTDFYELSFNDRSILIIKKEWNDKFNLQNVSSLREKDKFIKYILPVLRGDRLINKDLDERIELNEFINEIKAYSIQNILTDIQIQDASQSLIDLIQLCEQQKERYDTKCFNKSYCNRIDRFKRTWDQRVDDLATIFKQDYKDLKYEAILSFVESKTFPLIILMKNNILYYDNYIFWFFYHLNDVVFNKKDGSFDRFSASIESALQSQNCKTLQDFILSELDVLPSNLTGPIKMAVAASKLLRM